MPTFFLEEMQLSLYWGWWIRLFSLSMNDKACRESPLSQEDNTCSFIVLTDFFWKSNPQAWVLFPVRDFYSFSKEWNQNREMELVFLIADSLWSVSVYEKCIQSDKTWWKYPWMRMSGQLSGKIALLCRWSTESSCHFSSSFFPKLLKLGVAITSDQNLDVKMS